MIQVGPYRCGAGVGGQHVGVTFLGHRVNDTDRAAFTVPRCCLSEGRLEVASGARRCKCNSSSFAIGWIPPGRVSRLVVYPYRSGAGLRRKYAQSFAFMIAVGINMDQFEAGGISKL